MNAYENIKGKRALKRMNKKLSFWSKVGIKLRELFGMNSEKLKFDIITYLLFNIESVEEIMKINEKNSEKFENIYVISGLKFVEWLGSPNLKEELLLFITNVKELISNLKFSLMELEKIVSYNEILKYLISLQSNIEIFLKENRNSIKIQIDQKDLIILNKEDKKQKYR